MDGSVLTAGMDARTRSNLQARIRARADVVDGASAEALEPDAEIRKLLGVIEISAAPPERVKAGAAKLFARDPESLSAEEWTRLQTMLESDPAGAVLTGPRDLRGVDPMLTWIPDLASGRSSKVNNGLDRYFEAWRLQDATPEQLRDAAAELLARPSDALARRDWSRLAATFDVDEAGILPSVGTAGHDGEPAGKWLARLATGDRHHEHGELAEWFTAMRTALDPEHPKQVDAAVEALAAGAGSPGDAALLAGESQRVAALTAERTPVEQLRIADELLALDVVASTRGSRETLELVRDSLRRIEGVPDALDQPLRDARSMAKLNLQRLDQEIPNPGAPGAPRYPDYSEIGRIRSTVKLLRSIIDPRPAVSSTAAPTVTGAATDAAEAASGTLLW
jgi:hypothetical protein